MTRRPAARPADRKTELRSWLLAREEAAMRMPGAALPWTPEMPGYTGSQERLTALRNGDPASFYAGSLPRSVIGDRPMGACTYATVWPDGTVEIREDAAAFLVDNGL